MKLFESLAENIMTLLLDEEEYTALPTDRANAIFERHSFSNYISPVASKNNNEYIECNDGLFGVVLECSPRVRAGANAAMAFESILGKMPESAYMQVQIVGSSNLNSIIDLWEFEHLKRDNEVLRTAVKEMAQFFREKTNESITRSMQTKLKQTRLFVSFKHHDIKELVTLSKMAQNYLKSNHFNPRVMDFNALKPILFEFLNPHINTMDIPKYEPNRFFNRQSVSPDQATRVSDDCITFGKKVDGRVKGKSWTCMVLADLPEEAYVADMGKKLGNNISGKINDDQFRDNFIISWTVQRIKKKEYEKIESVQNVINKVRAKKEDRDLHEKKKEVYGILKKIDNRDPIFRCDIVVAVAGDTPEISAENATTVESFWNRKPTNIKLVTGSGVQAPLFQSVLPLGITDEYFTKLQNNPYYLFAEQCAQFLPVESDWVGNYPNMLAVTRRGCLFTLDIFKTSESKNFAMYGTSGAGKSATASYILLNHYAKGGRAFVIDVGDSYGGLIGEFGGVYLQPDKSAPISFNPFGDVETMEKLNEYLKFFVSFLYVIGGNKEPTVFKREQKFIKGKLEELIPQVWKECRANNKVMTITDIRDACQKSGDSRLTDFAVHLRSFCVDGVNGGFFEGKAQFDFNHDLVGLDTTKIKDDHELTEALIYVVSYFFSEAVYQGDGSQELIFWIDEFHKHMGKNQSMDEEVEEAYRTYRKHNGSVGVGTQGFNDLVDLHGQQNPIGKVVLTNSAWTFVGKQKEVARNLVVKSGLYDFSSEDEQALKAMDGIDGEYKEFLIISPDEQKTFVRWVYHPFFLKLISTKADEKYQIKAAMKELGISRSEAIKYIINQEKGYAA